MKSPERLPVLDGLRALSIGIVMAAHMLPLGRFNETAGAMGMSLFFSLSGFLIGSTLLGNSNVIEFFIRRFARIVPLAYGYIFIVSGLVFADPKMMLAAMSFVLNYDSQYLNSYTAHLWSLCVEVHFYLLIGVVVGVAGKNGVWVVWPACLAVTMLRVSQGAYIHIQTHLRIDEILVGACVATLYRTSWGDRVRMPAGFAVVAAVLWFVSSNPHTGWFQYLRPYATGLLLTAVLCQEENWLVSALSISLLRYIATVSYSLYVIHPLTVQGWFNQGDSFERYLFKRPISFALTFTAAHFSAFYWERPWLDGSKRWIKRRRERLQPV